MSNVSSEFKEAQSKLDTLKQDPGNDAKLKLYGLFKQASFGDCNLSKPSAVDFVNKAKWNAWNDFKGLSKIEAEKKYIEMANKLLGSGSTGSSKASSNPFQEILVSIEYGNIYKIVLNRPSKYNAISGQMYQEMIDALIEAESNPKVVLCVVTGNGSYYSSGNDLRNYMKPDVQNPEKEIERGINLVSVFVQTFINFKKPLIALVNGPCIGIMFTTLALFDLVIASDKAMFSAPFTELALSPEGCSSFTFPLLMGHQKASEILLFNRKLNAREAYERNLVNEVIADGEFKKKCDKMLEGYSKIPQNSLLESRNFIRDMHRDELLKVNTAELQLLTRRFKSGEFMGAVLTFMNKKAKL